MMDGDLVVVAAAGDKSWPLLRRPGRNQPCRIDDDDYEDVVDEVVRLWRRTTNRFDDLMIVRAISPTDVVSCSTMKKMRWTTTRTNMKTKMMTR